MYHSWFKGYTKIKYNVLLFIKFLIYNILIATSRWLTVAMLRCRATSFTTGCQFKHNNDTA